MMLATLGETHVPEIAIWAAPQRMFLCLAPEMRDSFQ